MKHNSKMPAALLLAAALLASYAGLAQRTAVRNAVEKKMEEKYGTQQRKRGQEEIRKITYENDKRYQDPNNKIQATIAFETKDFNKKGEVKNTLKDKIVFGKTGECMVMREGEKDEMWMVFNYADKANYMVNVRDKSAMKMPLINMKKMIERAARKEAERADDGASWKATDEWQTINGYKCRKFIYTYPDNPHFSAMDAWVSTEIRLDLSENYMLGARLNTYKFPEHTAYKDMINGFMVRSILYDKKGKPESQRDLVAFSPVADEKYFDMSPFKINDVLSGL